MKIFRYLYELIFGRSLRSALDTHKKVRINGVLFTIRKINVLDFLSGAHVLHQSFVTYEQKRQAGKIQDFDRLKSRVSDHYGDVFMSGVVKPKLSRDPGSENVCVQEILDDSDMSEKLYFSIFEHTYGKKKVRSLLSQASYSLNQSSQN